jgi:hypothetical protein
MSTVPLKCADEECSFALWGFNGYSECYVECVRSGRAFA